MTPHELVQKLIELQGDCGRFCAYCPDSTVTTEVKECVEKMYKDIYALQAKYDQMLEAYIKLRASHIQLKKLYKDATGDEFDESN